MLKGKKRKLFKKKRKILYYTRVCVLAVAYFRFVAHTRKKAKQPERVCACDA